MIDHLLIQDLQIAEGLEEDVADVLRTYDSVPMDAVCCRLQPAEWGMWTTRYLVPCTYLVWFWVVNEMPWWLITKTYWIVCNEMLFSS